MSIKYGFIKEVEGTVAGKPGKIKLYGCDHEFRAHFLAWRAENTKWDDKRIASEIGRSPAMIYQYCHAAGCAYAGNVKGLEEKLAELMRDCHLELDTNISTIACDISAQIADAVEEIRTAKRIGVIIGEPGIGKTRGTHEYIRDHKLAILFGVNAWNKREADFASCLFKASDLEAPETGLRGMKELVNKMTGSGRSFLVDDAHKLTCAALQLAFDFRDASGSPIILLGDHRLVAKLKRDHQRLRRTGIVRYLKIQDATALINHHIDTFAPDCGSERKELAALCQQIVAGPGHFGSLQMELSVAARIKRGDAELSWCDCMRGAHARLIRDYELN